MKQRICKLCNKSFTTIELKNHILDVHKISFDIYLRKYFYDKEVGFCLNCGKKTKVSLYKYSKYCNNKCQLEYQYKNETEEDKKLRKEKLSKSWTKEKKEKQSKKHIKINEKLDNDYYKNRYLKIKKTLKEKYGNENAFQFNSVQFKENMKKLYGKENYFELSDKRKEYEFKKINNFKKNIKKNQNWILAHKNKNINLKQSMNRSV